MKIVKITIVKTNSEKVRGRADIYFDEFLLKGFKVLQDPKSLKEYVTPPSYLSKMGWRPLFRTVNPQDWHDIEKEVLSAYNTYLMKETADEITEEE